jgi:DNA-binding beta-propeller fold protein YncE
MRTLHTLLLTLLSLGAYTQIYNIYVSDAGNFNNPPWQILKFDSDGENPQVFIDSELGWPQDILFLQDSDDVLISNLSTNKINRHNGTTGDFVGEFATGIGGPTRMKIGSDGLLYVLQWNGNGYVLRYEMDGSYLGAFTSVSVPQSIGMDWDGDGNLYVSSYSDDLVHKFGPSGEDLGVFIDSDLLGPTNIWFDSNGDLLVSDYNGTAVKRFDPDGNYVEDFMEGLSNSEGVAILQNGDYLIGNGADSSVKLFDSDGNYVEDFIPSGSGDLLTPNAVVIGPLSFNSVSENEGGEQRLILPTVGKVFYINSRFLTEIESIKLLDMSGRIIRSKSNLIDAIWDLESEIPGSYVAQIQMRDGSQLTEQIIIAR